MRVAKIRGEDVIIYSLKERFDFLKTGKLPQYKPSYNLGNGKLETSDVPKTYKIIDIINDSLLDYEINERKVYKNIRFSDETSVLFRSFEYEASNFNSLMPYKSNKKKVEFALFGDFGLSLIERVKLLITGIYHPKVKEYPINSDNVKVELKIHPNFQPSLAKIFDLSNEEALEIKQEWNRKIKL